MRETIVTCNECKDRITAKDWRVILFHRSTKDNFIRHLSVGTYLSLIEASLNFDPTLYSTDQFDLCSEACFSKRITTSIDDIRTMYKEPSNSAQFVNVRV